MRLTDIQRQHIKQTVAEVFGAESRVWLFGSRVDDTKRGGDIDLLIETPQAIPNKATLSCRLEGALVMRLGERKIDTLLKDTNTLEAPILIAAKQTGVLL